MTHGPQNDLPHPSEDEDLWMRAVEATLDPDEITFCHQIRCEKLLKKAYNNSIVKEWEKAAFHTLMVRDITTKHYKKAEEKAYQLAESDMDKDLIERAEANRAARDIP